MVNLWRLLLRLLREFHETLCECQHSGTVQGVKLRADIGKERFARQHHGFVLALALAFLALALFRGGDYANTGESAIGQCPGVVGGIARGKAGIPEQVIDGAE